MRKLDIGTLQDDGVIFVWVTGAKFASWCRIFGPDDSSGLFVGLGRECNAHVSILRLSVACVHEMV